MKRRSLFAAAVLILVLFLAIFAFRKRSDPVRILGSSMEPVLIGPSFLFSCSSCGSPFRITCELSSRSSESEIKKSFLSRQPAVSCPFCGYTGIPVQSGKFRFGYPLFLSKIHTDQKTLNRFSIAAFEKEGLFYIKRIVGLPGEKISVHQGDLRINGKIFRKDPDQIRKQFVPLRHIEKEQKDHRLFLYYKKPSARNNPADPKRMISVPITNQSEIPRMETEPFDQYENVRDFILDLYKDPLLKSKEFTLLINRGEFLYLLKIDSSGRWKILRKKTKTDSKKFPIPNIEKILPEDFTESIASGDISDRKGNLSVYSCDDRLTMTLHGTPLCNADLEEKTDTLCPITIPFILFSKEPDDSCFQLFDDSCFRVFRDIHYTASSSTASPSEEISAPPKEYYVLGDHSPVSIDSRNWNPPTIPASSFIGTVPSVVEDLFFAKYLFAPAAPNPVESEPDISVPRELEVPEDY
ncbi:MAG: S26 family signal peptidase [Planctomycetia bacterium]|nr:S26 family signal peptidase [Planctomycetia bacterium]